MKKHLLRLAFINGLLFLSICIFAQEYSDFYFTRVNGENGLSESNVKAILQDSYGFMWFGTKNGLNRYDGTSILQFDCDDLEVSGLWQNWQRIAHPLRNITYLTPGPSTDPKISREWTYPLISSLIITFCRGRFWR